MWGRIAVALVSVVILLTTGYAWNSMTDLRSAITQISNLELGGGEDGAVDILLVGTDSRTDAQGNPLTEEEQQWLQSGDEVATNTDTILLIRIPNDGSSATAISIPRDSYVQVPGIGMSKINAAYGATREEVRGAAVESGKTDQEAETEGTQAGRRALIDTVAELTGVEVDHYAEVGLLGFVLLTNAAGGVDVCLNEAVNEPMSGANFPAGQQTLDGSQALSFVRQRHGLPRGDLDRITRQQVFMASLARKMLSANTLADPAKLNELQAAIARSVVIDDGWDVIQFAEQLQDLSGGNVQFDTIPIITEQGWSEDGLQSVIEVDPAEVKAFTSKLLGDEEEQTGGEENTRVNYTVDVVNAGTVEGLAGNVSNILTNTGFIAGETSNAPANIRDSVIRANDPSDPGAQMLARDLGGLAIEADSSLAPDRLRVVLTNTYEGVGGITDTGPQENNTPPSEQAAGNRPPVTAAGNGPVCVN